MLVASEATFHDILAADLWEYNYDQLSITAESMMRLPFITRIEVTIPGESTLYFSNSQAEDEQASAEGLFWHEFELNYIEDDLSNYIGKVRIYSNTFVILGQIKSGLYTLLINAIIKTIALIILVTVVFNWLLTRPLEKLAHHAESIDTESPEFKPIKVADNPKDELGLLQTAMNRMMVKTTDTIKKLDGFNKDLETKIADRTQKLRGTVSQLDKEKVALKSEVESRKKGEIALSNSLIQLKQAQVKLVASEKMASLGTLAAGIAHEINNPITFVLQNVNVLGEYNEAFHTLIKDYKSLVETGLKVDGDAKKILGRIQQYEEEEDLEFIISDSLSLLKSTEDGISRVVDIVKNMKSFSHPDVENIHSVDVHEVLTSTLLLLKNEIPVNVQIATEFNANAFVVQSNRNQLGQVFLNLIMNSLQAISENSDGIIRIQTESNEQHIFIHIIDTGCGIPEEKIKLIFDPFYTTKEVGEGTGMGLSISYGIVKKYNGKIGVSSVPDKGTKITIQFLLKSDL